MAESRSRKIKPDKFIVLKTVETYLRDNYGVEGLKNVKVVLSKSGDGVIFKCQKSIWRTELKLNEQKIIDVVNKKIKTTAVQKCFFY